MKLADMLPELFEEQATMFSTHGLPIKAQVDSGPLIPIERWKIIDSTGRLTKKFNFRNIKMRNMFVRFLLSYEEEVGHNAIISIDENDVKLELITKNINKVTEIDKEYARFADANFKDVLYNPVDGT